MGNPPPVVWISGKGMSGLRIRKSPGIACRSPIIPVKVGKRIRLRSRVSLNPRASFALKAHKSFRSDESQAVSHFRSLGMNNLLLSGSNRG